MKYARGSLKACVNGFIARKTQRGGVDKSEARKIKDAGGKTLTPESVIKQLDIQNWESPFEYGIHFYVAGQKDLKGDGIAYFKSCGKYVKSTISEAEKFGYVLASMDRIDSSLPYSADNIQFVSTDFNKFKSTLSTEEVLDRAKRIHN